MTTITIDIPETQLAAIAAKAKAQGITLQDWFRQVAEREAAAAFKRLKSLFNILAETPAIYPVWESLVTQHRLLSASRGHRTVQRHHAGGLHWPSLESEILAARRFPHAAHEKHQNVLDAMALPRALRVGGRSWPQPPFRRLWVNSGIAL